ncbi:type VI secretion system lipoprotein TssJ [Pseudomonas sp. MWU13-2100]|uniref:type VI secretion system lipoprotein TssJ n=1 Tax=Pseudomonas sp. MWU13-2100 TaxID=2935075 RepID=UPI00200DCF03|nr:type VI secretion system lipoprotein TssJ [Pseudomonas sp. MWU13-2100]
MTRFKTLASVWVLILLAGCSALSPYSSETKLNLKLSASDQLNPDLNGRPSPIVLRLLELKHPVAFQNADFFSLYDRAKDILSQDLVASEEIELRPGETLDLKLTVKSESRFVAVLAAYRDLPATQWRYVIPVDAQQLTRIDLNLDKDGIQNAADKLAKAGDRS